MTIYATNGSRLYIGGPITVPSSDLNEASFAAQSWVEVGEVENLGTVGDTSAEITFDSISANRTRRLKGTRNAGTMEIVCGIDYDDAGQIAIIAAEKTIHDYAFRMELNDAPAPQSATVTISNASPGVVTWTAHGLPVNTPVVLSTTGALPTGLSPGTYYVKTVLTADTFTLSATPGGTVINTSGAGSGTHTATTAPQGSQRMFAAKVASASEALDAANSVMKLNPTLWVNSNIVRVAPLG